MKLSAASVFLTLVLCAAAPACAGARDFPLFGGPDPFTTLSSTNTPLVFGMNVEEAARVLEQPLSYVSGRPGDEIYLAFRNTSGNGLFYRRDLLYLQFRRGKLTGWKGESGHDWVWHW